MWNSFLRSGLECPLESSWGKLILIPSHRVEKCKIKKGLCLEYKKIVKSNRKKQDKIEKWTGDLNSYCTK